MAWAIRFTARADKDFSKLGSGDRSRVLRFLDERIRPADDARSQGKALQGEYAGMWRYRVGDIRVIARLEHKQLIVLVVEIGNRREIYR
ncbi:MAG: type II toxin-antitoxin system RelE/ParE family toxin [Devosia sp.]